MPLTLNRNVSSRGLMFLSGPPWFCRQTPLRPIAEASPEKRGNGPDLLAAARATGYQVAGGTAVIPVRGVLVKDPWYLDEISIPLRVAAIRDAAANRDVKTIVLWVDSPGGSSDGSADLADAVRDAAKVKTVIAQVDGMAASAAYWMAAQATKVYLKRTDLVGSLGVFTYLIDDSKWAEENGIKVHAVTTGEFKGVGMIPGQEITEAQVADIQRVVNGYFDAFVADVMRGRGMSRSAVMKLATGSLWQGQEAVSLGLADGVKDVLGAVTAPAPESRYAANYDLELSIAEAEQKLAATRQSSGKRPGQAE